jgi:L-aspartate oxidase
MQVDVLIVGAGAAGLYTALGLPPDWQVLILTKDELSASGWAQGGIAAAVSQDDSAQLHLEDTLSAGAGLCDRPAVQYLVENASRCIERLVDMGVAFDRQGPDLALTLEAAHSRRRVLHSADTTGHAVVSILAAQVRDRPNLQVWNQALTLDIAQVEGRCAGVSVLYQGQVHWIGARVVILATGGGGQVFAQTTNPTLSTGDGVAIAHRAGALLRDLEFFQFHPTALTLPGAPRFLISEAVRGEGAHLVDRPSAKSGDEAHRFAFDYHPQGELAPRDVVSRAIYQFLQTRQSQSGGGLEPVYLDMRPIPQATLAHRFPNIIQICQQWGVDVFTQPVPVAPAAHYWMGGIQTDLANQTTVPGLYAVGETASTGVHGANRLASNSLLECLVFGAQFADLQLPPATPLPLTPDNPPSLAIAPAEIAQLQQLRLDLPRLIWQSAGICRQADLLQAAIAQVQQWQIAWDQLSLSGALAHLVPGQSWRIEDADAVKLWSETRNLLDIAQLILVSADFRTESRGGHYRQDFPHTLPEWQVHTLVQSDFSQIDRWFTGAVEA